MEETNELIVEEQQEAGDVLKGVIEAYRDLLREANPEAVAELIQGETVEELNESVTSAKAAFAKAKEQALRQIAGSQVGVGGERSSGIDPSSLNPLGKIAMGLRSTK